jgi:hypothetical protein
LEEVRDLKFVVQWQSNRSVVFNEGMMMINAQKVRIMLVRLVAFGFVVCTLVSITGCGSWAQLGETTAEGRRRQARVRAINRAQLMADINTFFLYDKPLRLTHLRLP